LKPQTIVTSSLEQAFELYYPSIFRYFRFRGADADTTNDLASSTFERALKGHYDSRKSQIQTWLFAIARNISIIIGNRNPSTQLLHLMMIFPVLMIPHWKMH